MQALNGYLSHSHMPCFWYFVNENEDWTQSVQFKVQLRLAKLIMWCVRARSRKCTSNFSAFGFGSTLYFSIWKGGIEILWLFEMVAMLIMLEDRVSIKSLKVLLPISRWKHIYVQHNSAYSLKINPRALMIFQYNDVRLALHKGVGVSAEQRAQLRT